ncbi:MAG: hypothetical protein PHT89_11970, partial [Lachnospiraceae bacterium]|nr:hypothetical protein [Lachnospiraceae bacterium]
MNTGIRIRNFFFLLISLVACTMILIVYPGNMFHNTTVEKVGNENCISGDIISMEHSVMQEFFPTNEKLSEISVKIDSLGQQDGLFYFNIYDKELNKLFSTVQRLRNSQDGSELFYQFPVSLSVTKGAPYYYTIDYKDASLAVCLSEVTSENTVSGKTYFALEELPNQTAISVYEYTEPLKTSQIILIDLTIVLIAASLIAACALIPGFAARRPQLTYVKAVKMFLTSVIVAVSAYCMIQIIFYSVFTYEQADKMVLSSGVLILATVLLVTIWNYKLPRILFNRDQIVVWLVNLMQSVFWAKAILSCI